MSGKGDKEVPIKPENKKRYPSNWKDIRADILKRANNKCEFCGIENYTIKENGSKVVLTIAHLDHTPENCDYNNLRALCQKCHNNYDKEHRKETRRMTKIRSLKKGDTIKCHDKEEMINLMYELQKENIETDFIYEKDGVKGLWLIVTNVAVLADTTNTKI